MQIRVDARLCIFYIGVSQLWDVLLSCFYLTRVLTRRFVRKKRETRIEDG